jgi:hypothetical protein
VDPSDRKALMQVFETNTCLWGGVYNFIVPLFKRIPKRYRVQHSEAPSAKELVNGLVDAFEPDFLVDVGRGTKQGLVFPKDRIVALEDIFRRKENPESGYGITSLSIYAALYDRQFRFVQRHPPRVLVPKPNDLRLDLLFAATFGVFPRELHCRSSKIGSLSRWLRKMRS